VHCHVERYSVKKLKEDRSAIGWIVGKSTKRIRTRELADIFNRVSDEDVALVGQTNHPKIFILFAIPVSPVQTRPETRAMSTGRVRINDQTVWLKVLLADLKAGPDMAAGPDDIKLNQHYYEMIYGQTSQGNAKNDKNQAGSIKELIPGKTTGIIRKNLLGKRVHCTCRLVISGDSSLELHQVGIPRSEAIKLNVPETVDSTNIERMRMYFENADTVYPGCSKIIKKNGNEYRVEPDMNTVIVEIGDVIHRNLITGDHIVINRAPSLLPSAEVAMTAVIHDYHTITFNVMNCPLFNADFDGDAMTGYVMQSEGSKIEASLVSCVSQFMIAHKNSIPLIGQVQDSVIGLAQLSNSKVKYSKLNAMRSIGITKLNPKFIENKYTGYDLLTMSLAGDGIDINFNKKPTVFKEESHLPFIAPLFNKVDKQVEIKNGVYLGGILDKSSIAGGATSGLYHTIYSQYGPEKSLDAMYNMQQLAIMHLQFEEFTIGYGDLINDNGASSAAAVGEIPPEPKLETLYGSVTESIKLLELENNKQVEILDNGDVYAPIGKTVEEHFENIQTNILRMLDMTNILMSSIDPINNNIYKMISYGSKGKFPNLQLMTSVIGLIQVNEKMAPKSFGYKRTLPYFQKCDLSIYSKGFVPASYVSGMSVSAMLFNSMAERHSIIMKALYTAVIGAESRTAIKNLESVIINNLRQAVNGNLLLQPIYGGDGVDTRKVIQVTIPNLLISNEKLEDIYGPGGKEYLELIKSDRESMRKAFMILYKAGHYAIMSGTVSAPIDVSRIVDAIDKSPSGDLELKIKRVIEYTTDEIHYIMMNELAKNIKANVPEYLFTSTTLCKYLVRAHLTPKVLETISLENLEEIILRINYHYLNSLIDYGMAVGIIAAQCVSEPLTQYVLHSIHHAVSGGTKKGGVAKLKEIISPKESNRLDAVMTIYLNNGTDSNACKWVASNIQLLSFNEFVVYTQLVEEYRYGEVIHPELEIDKKMFAEFAKYYPLIVPPNNLIKWFLRFNINREKLLLKSISLIKIIDGLRKIYKNSFIVHSDENNKEIIIRMYWTATTFKTYPDKNMMDVLIKTVLESNIRGVEMVLNASDKDVAGIDFMDDGSIKKDKKESVVVTNGSNVYGVLMSPVGKFIDPLRIVTDSIMETLEMFGIEEAQLSIIEELRKITPDTNPRHLMIYAAEMCSSGIVTSIERKGLRSRQLNNILLRVAHQFPITSLVYAAENNIKAPVNSISGSLIMGAVPKVGTHYNSIIINEEFVKQHIISEEEQIANMSDL
jgi:DNA-directed RNA polymerase beta' subunit